MILLSNPTLQEVKARLPLQASVVAGGVLSVLPKDSTVTLPGMNASLDLEEATGAPLEMLTSRELMLTGVHPPYPGLAAQGSTWPGWAGGAGKVLRR